MKELSWAILFLVVFLLITCFLMVTNFRIVWMTPIAGISAGLSAIAFLMGK